MTTQTTALARRVTSPEVRAKISASLKASMTPEKRAAIAERARAAMTPEKKAELSAKARGRITPEYRESQRQASLARWNRMKALATAGEASEQTEDNV